MLNSTKIDKFIEKLSLYSYHNKNCFNPWKDVDLFVDVPSANIIRQENLLKFLYDRLFAEVIFVGEAPGYNGCRFSGVPFYDEYRLSLLSSDYKQSSISKNLKKERTSSIVYNNFNLWKNNLYWVAWNIFPFHPYKNGYKTRNRHPDSFEIIETIELLYSFLQIYKNSKIYAIGRISEYYINNIYKHNKKVEYIPHPSWYGAKNYNNYCNSILFKKGICND